MDKKDNKYSDEGFTDTGSKNLSSEDRDYAGFWERFAAHLIDNLILSVPISIISFLIIFLMLSNSVEVLTLLDLKDPDLITGNYDLSDDEALIILLEFMKAAFVTIVVSLLINWLYFALMESSKWQGTLGKKLLSIKVANRAGERISFWTASLRFVIKTFLSPILMIGFILVLFTERKQALHDIAAKTIVIK